MPDECESSQCLSDRRHSRSRGEISGAEACQSVRHLRSRGDGKIIPFRNCCDMPEIREVKVKGRGKKSLEAFVEYVKKTYPHLERVEAVETVEELIRDTDIAAFTNSGGTDPSTYPFVKGEWIKPGALIIGVSCFDMDAEFMKAHTTLVVDNMQLYEAWAEEFPYPSFGANNIIGSKFTDMVHDGVITKDDIYDLGDIIYDKKPGRVSDDQIFIYSVGGMPGGGRRLGKGLLRSGQGAWTWNKADPLE